LILTFNGGELSGPMAIPMSMNNGATPGGGTIVGLFSDMANRQHGYVVRNGMLESYDPTFTSTTTAIWDINPSQQFVGTYRESGEPTAKRHAFAQRADGSAPLTFDFTCQNVDGCPGAPYGAVAFATIAYGVNPQGVIVGQYVPVSGDAPHAFVAIPEDVN
jgi:hypothetical protein